jgi:hypothetical protein
MQLEGPPPDNADEAVRRREHDANMLAGRHHTGQFLFDRIEYLIDVSWDGALRALYYVFRPLTTQAGVTQVRAITLGSSNWAMAVYNATHAITLTLLGARSLYADVVRGATLKLLPRVLTLWRASPWTTRIASTRPASIP